MAEEKLDLKTMSKKLSAGAAYRKMMAAHEQGKPIVVASAAVPSEVFYAMDLYPIFPESLAAISSGIRKAEEFFSSAKDKSYSNSICSYTRCGLGISWLSKCAFGPIPEPDVFVGETNLCCMHVTWWRYLEDSFNKPNFMLDMPAINTLPDEDYIHYYEGQIKGLIEFLEDNTKIKFEESKFKAAVSYSDLAGHYWKQIMDIRKHKPSPASFRDLAGQILPIVTFAGDPDAADFYKVLYESYKDRVEKGIGPAEKERFRLMWFGIPVWHRLDMINYFESKGAVFVYEPYTSLSWGNKVPSGRLDPEHPYRTLAEKYTMVIGNRSIDQRLEIFNKAVKDYSIDGAVFFNNRSCRPQSIGQEEVSNALKEKYGIPVMFFEGDMGDPEAFNWEEVKARIDGYLEVLESQKK